MWQLSVDALSLVSALPTSTSRSLYLSHGLELDLHQAGAAPLLALPLPPISPTLFPMFTLLAFLPNIRPSAM